MNQTNWVPLIAAVLTIVCGAIAQAVVASFYIGKITGTVESHEKRIDDLEDVVDAHGQRISILEGRHHAKSH